MKKLLLLLFILGFISVQAQQKRSLTPVPNMVADANYRIGCSLFNDPNNYTTGSSFSFNAPVNNNSYLIGPGGASYGCLYSVPNQAWFIITVNTSGNLYFNFSNTYGYDVDAAIWGPIVNNDMSNACSATQSYPLTCDYDTGRPDLYINNAQAGQKYVMLVTNYSNANTVINISQPSGGSVTYAMVNLPNCSMIPTASISGTSTTITEGQAATLNLNFTGSSPWNYTLSDGTMGTSYSSSTNLTVYPTASQTYTVNSVSNLCGTNGGSGSVGISVIRSVDLKTCLPLDGNATDSKALNSGTLQNGVSATTNRNNESGKALQFDGIDDYVSLPTNQLNNNTFTFAAWVKLDELPNSVNTEVVALTLGGGWDEHYVGVEYYNGAATWKFSSNDANVYSTATVNTNWHLLVGVRSGGQIKLYVDGVLTGTSSVSGSASYGSPLLARIGSSISNNKFFKGKIDDAKFFNSSLIDPEILLLQNYTSENNCNNVVNDTFISLQSISTSVICAGNSFVVRAFSNNLFPDNETQFSVELSDINGSFNNPRIIGSSSFLPVTVTIPTDVVGGSYKIRIRYGANISVNSFDIFINKASSYNIAGAVTLNDGQSTILTLNFTGTGPWNYILSDGLSGVATTSPWQIVVSPDQTTTYSINSAQNVCGYSSSNGNTSATVTVNFTKQLVTCLPFNANANDEKGNNTLTLNGPILAENRYGQINSAYAFNGSNDYMEYSTNLLRKREYTMSAWVLASSIPGNTRYILSQGETGTNTFQGLAMTSYGWEFHSYSNNGFSSTYSSTGFAANQWVHLTAVRTYTHMKLYVNGNLVSTVANNSIIPFKSSDIGRIGANSSSLGNYFNGKIDDVRLYKGALNDEEVYTLYASTGSCPTVENSSIIVSRGVIPTTVCAGNTVSVSYSLSNVNVSSGFPLTVQLSDQNGSFASPVNIGSGSTSPITATIPGNNVSSNFYRIRLVSTSGTPVTSVNSSTLTVSGSIPTASISGGGSIPFGGTTNLTVSFTGIGPWTYTINNGVATTTSVSPVTIPVSPVGTTTYTITSISNNCGSGTSSGSVTVTVAPNISLGSIGSSFCQGLTFSIPFVANYTPIPNFKVELSDASGSFASPTIIGTGASSPISVTIPNNTPEGVSYKIRIVSASPAYASAEFTNLAILIKPTATIAGTTTIDYGQSANLTLTFTGAGPWTYAINNGTAKTTSTNPLTVTVSPTATTTYMITSLSSNCGAGTAAGSAIVTVNPIITLGTVGTNFCEGQNISVPFTFNFTPSSALRLELSDSIGNFISPVVIGTGITSPIVAVIPTNISSGSGYKIRIVSDSPAAVSALSGGITIKKKATASISGTTTISNGQSTNLTVNFTGDAPWTYRLNNGSAQVTNSSLLIIPVSPTATNNTYTITSISNTCGTGITSGSAVVTVENTAYLLSCYKFDGNADDAYGTYHGALFGGVSMTTDRFNNPNSAYEFDGVDDYIKIPMTSLADAGDYSFSMWVNFASIPSNNNTRTNIFAVTPASGPIVNNTHAIEMSSGGAGVVINYTYPCSPESQCDRAFSRALTPSTWYHFVLTRQSNTFRFYINGNLVASSYSFTETYPISNNFVGLIGKGLNPSNSSNPNVYFNGKIDDLKIFKRALNFSQVKALYDQTNCDDITEAKVVSLDDVSSTNYCRGTNLNVYFAAHYSVKKPLKVQLSDANGSFATPVEIGSGSNNPFSVQIPANQPAGTGYRVRLVSSDETPVISNESVMIDIKEPPTASISGTATINEGQTTNLTVNFTGKAPWTYTITGSTSQTTSTTPVTVSVAPIITTTYTVTSLSNICGNGTRRDTAFITVKPVAVRQISCFAFSGNTNDTKGINNATNYGATLTTDRFGNANSAFNFSAVGYIKDDPSTNLENTEFTVSLWFNSSSNQATNTNYTILNLATNTFVLKRKANGGFAIQFTGMSNLGADFYQFDLPNYTAGIWHSMVFIHSIEKIYLYIDNNLIASVNPNVGYEAASYGYPRRIVIGSVDVNYNNFVGKIDDIQIYKGVLTSGQIQALSTTTQGCFDATSYKCLSDVTYSTILSGQETLKVSNQILSSNTILNGANIYFDAKNSIILQPGFKTEGNAVFKATVGGGCIY